MKAIINGKIILKDRIVENRALLYTDVIEGIVDMDKVPAGAEVIDAKGGYVAPGLIEMHIHGYLGKDVCDGNVESIKTISEGIVKNGVTAFLPTTMTESMETIVGSLESIREGMKQCKDWNGATVLGAHAEGPFISPSKKGAQDEQYILKPDAEFVKKYADVIKTITLAPEEDTEDFAAIREINKATDVVISMGHTSATYETAMASTQVGVKHVTHFFNAMTALSHRAPGVVTAGLNADVSIEVIVDTVHVSTAFYDMLYKLKGRKLVFVTDCLPAGGLPDGQYTLGNQPIIYKDNICKLLDGTIAGSVLKLNMGVWNVYTNSNIPLHECVNGATLNPATTLGIQDKKGSLEVGKDADIIITNDKFDVNTTIIGGVVKYNA